jgi:prophage tail gpP-like protein
MDRLYISPLPQPKSGYEAPDTPQFGPQANQNGVLDAAIALDHIVTRPDLVRVDADGSISEIATLIVGGLKFEDWESVWIQWSWADAFSQFRFSCAEREPYPLPGQVLQFAPGTTVEIYLGGVQVITGVIITRQVAYDAESHVVQLQGVSSSWFAARSGIDHKTSDFDGKSFTQIASEILGPTGVGFTTVGEIDETPFKSGATPSAGETIIAFLERLARDRKIIVSNTPDGKFLFIGDHEWPPTGDLIEGINIKKMQCVISSDTAYSDFVVKAQKAASDSEWGAKASEQEARVKGSLGPYSILLTAIEHPVWTAAEVAKRAQTEKMWNDDLGRIDANVLVYGWFRPLPQVMQTNTPPDMTLGGPTTGHTLWMPGDDVIVHSPMAMLYQQPLKIRTVTWTQDNNGGTQTLLQCTLPEGLNGHPVPKARSDPNKPAETPADQPENPPVDPPTQAPATVSPPGDWMPDWLRRLQIGPTFDERFGNWPNNAPGG